MKIILDMPAHEIDSLLLILDTQRQSTVNSFRKNLIEKLMNIFIQCRSDIVIQRLGLMKQ